VAVAAKGTWIGRPLEASNSYGNKTRPSILIGQGHSGSVTWVKLKNPLQIVFYTTIRYSTSYSVLRLQPGLGCAAPCPPPGLAPETHLRLPSSGVAWEGRWDLLPQIFAIALFPRLFSRLRAKRHASDHFLGLPGKPCCWYWPPRFLTLVMAVKGPTLVNQSPSACMCMCVCVSAAVRSISSVPTLRLPFPLHKLLLRQRYPEAAWEKSEEGPCRARSPRGDTEEGRAGTATQEARIRHKWQNG